MRPNPSHQNQTQARRFARHSIVDHQNDGMLVSTFSHPSDWKAISQVVWNMEHTELPGLVHAIAYNPGGTECFEFLPMQAFFWLENNFGTVPIGQNQHGLVRMPPMPAPDALAKLVIPAFRRDRQNLRVTSVQPVQNLSQLFHEPPPQQGESVMARVEYEEHGRTIEEEFYGVYSWNQGMQLNWGFGRLFCFRAGRGQLDAVRQTFWQIAGSLEPNPQWKQRYDQTAQQLKAGFMVRISQTYARFESEKRQGLANIALNEQIRNRRDAGVNASIDLTHRQNRERLQDHFNQQEVVGNILIDRTPFHDPNSAAGNPHYVEGNYLYNFTNNQGEFYSTNDPMDNPNRRKAGNWVEATPVDPHS